MGKRFEELAPLPGELKELLQARAENLEWLVRKKEKAVKEAPEGAVRIVKRGNKLQFYKKSGSGDYQGTYLPREQDALALALVQKDYDERLLHNARAELEHIRRFEAALEGKSACTAAYEALDDTRKSLVTPATLTDEQFAVAWLSVPYKKKKLDSAAPTLVTENGETVRSKSELIIANALKNSGVPYRYEYPVCVTVGEEEHREFHPDFYCLNVRTRAEFAWEHFGMMDEPEYAENAVHKLAAYSASGYFPGKNLIITMENRNTPLGSLEINRIINEYLK